MKKWVLALLFVLALAAVPLYLLPLFFPWSKWNCEFQDIDITSGQVRFTKYKMFMKVSEQVKDTGISDILPESDSPDWRLVNTFSPGSRHSPHHIFHGAFGQLNQLESYWNIFNMTQEEKIASASHLLAIWQLTGSRFGGGDYLMSLFDLFERASPEERLDFVNLKMPEKKKNDTYTQTVFFTNGNPMASYEGFVDPKTDSFIKDGVWRMWNSENVIIVYGHFRDGRHHGRRFEWDHHGRLSGISAFNRGRLVEAQGRNLSDHPEYKTAQQIAGGNK